MKVLQLINSLATGGAEKLLLETIPKYKKEGVEMDVLVLNGTVHPFYAALQKQGVAIFSLSKTSVYNPLHIFRLIGFLKKYDIVHVHLFPALYWASFAKWIGFSKAKIIFTEHSTSNRRADKWFFQKMDRFVYSKYDAVVGITSEVREKIQKRLGLPDSKLAVIENGIDLSKIETASAYDKTALQLPPTAKLLIQVSSFHFPKDQSTVVRSLQYLPDDVHLLLAGEGPLQNEAVALAERIGLAGRVHFLGVRMDVPSLLKMADIVILSSAYEGLSLSCIEGMASGNPFVASDVEGLREIVSGAGVLFPLGDEKKLAAIINDLLTDLQKSAAIAKKCQARAQQFDSAKMIENHLKLYRSLV